MITESTIEETARSWFKEMGFTVLHGSISLRGLTGIHDTPLPKLMSGEVGVENIKIITGGIKHEDY